MSTSYMKAIDPETGMVSDNKVWAYPVGVDDPVMISDDEPAWLEYLQATVPLEIDQQVAMIYQTWMRFQAEYEAREAAATAFKAANYAGDAGVWVTAFATAAGLTPQAATDLILAQAVGLRSALAALGAARMRKYEITTATDVATAKAAAESINAAINSISSSIQ